MKEQIPCNRIKHNFLSLEEIKGQLHITAITDVRYDSIELSDANISKLRKLLQTYVVDKLITK